MKIIAMDVGGTFIKWSVLDEQLNILEQGKFPSESLIVKTKGIISKVANMSNFLLTKYEDIKYVGISFPGIIDSKTSLILTEANNLPESLGINIQKEFNKECLLKVIVLNDANAATLGEMAVGQLKGVDNGVFITFGTGIGGGIIINGNLYEGQMFTAGEMGSLFINGRRWEESCSIRSLITKASLMLGEPEITGEDIFEISKDNSMIREMLDKWLEDIAMGISNIIHMINPEVIVIGGGASENELFDINVINKHLIKLVEEQTLNSTKIVKSLYGNDTALYGVAYILNNSKSDVWRKNEK